MYAGTIFTFAFVVRLIEAHFNGASTLACNDLTPIHGSQYSSQLQVCPYDTVTDKVNQDLLLSLSIEPHVFLFLLNDRSKLKRIPTSKLLLQVLQANLSEVDHL